MKKAILFISIPLILSFFIIVIVAGAIAQDAEDEQAKEAEANESNVIAVTFDGTENSTDITLNIHGGIEIKDIKGKIGEEFVVEDKTDDKAEDKTDDKADKKKTKAVEETGDKTTPTKEEKGTPFTATKKEKGTIVAPGDNHASIWSYLINKGFSPASSAAIMGCWECESSCDPSAVEMGDEAYFNAHGYTSATCGHGLAQWTFGRCTKLLDTAKKQGKDWTDLQFQLDYFYKELSTSYMTASQLNAFKKVTDVDEATRTFFMSYESGGQELPSYQAPRKANAHKLYTKYKLFKAGIDAKLGGRIDGNKITITGTVNGIEIVGTGEIKDNKIDAKGWFGEGASAMSGDYINPFGGKAFTITSVFGNRSQPTAGASTSHGGWDLCCDNPTAGITAVAGGRVTTASEYGGYGKCVIIDCGNGITNIYGHLSQISVNVGDTVTQGQQIGNEGSTGVSTGNHLHLEFRLNNKQVDPWDYMQNVLRTGRDPDDLINKGNY